MSVIGNGVENGTKAVRRRPAETSGIAGAVAILVAHLLGVTNPDVIVALAVVVGALPAIVTWTLETVAHTRKGAP